MSTINKSSVNEKNSHPEHAAELLQQLQLLQNDGENGGGGLCDVVLIAGKNGQRVPAHRVVLAASSPYFRTMFTVKMRESTAAEVTEDVHGDILLPLVRFCYTGEIEICAETVDELLRTAHRLQLNAVVSDCSKFIERRLDASNCIGVAALAELLSLDDLKQSAEKYTCSHFVQVSQQEEFLQLNIDQFKVLIGSDELHVPSEESIFQSVISWVHYDKDVKGKRSEHISALMGLVRLSLLPPSFLMQHVWNFCHEHQACLPLLKEALEEAIVPTINRRIKPRKSMQSNVLAVWTEDGKPLSISLYSPVEDEWKLLDKTFSHRTDFAATFFNDELIVAGGLQSGYVTNTVESINLDTMTLLKLPSMMRTRRSFGVAVLDGLLYAAGGFDETGEGNSVERYDPKECKWSDVASLSVGRYLFGLAVLDGRLFAVGGSNHQNTYLHSTECYDPQTNKWTLLANLNIPRFGFGIASGNGFLYIVGGYDHNLQQLKSIERYDQQADKWTEICQLSSPRHTVSCVFFVDRLLVLSSHDKMTSLQEYNFATDKWTERAKLVSHDVAQLRAMMK